MTLKIQFPDGNSKIVKTNSGYYYRLSTNQFLAIGVNEKFVFSGHKDNWNLVFEKGNVHTVNLLRENDELTKEQFLSKFKEITGGDWPFDLSE